MRYVLAILVVGALGWSGYWVWSAQMLRGEITGWLEARQSEGWQAEATDVTVSGYPLRFQTDLTSLALADPDTGVAWIAPMLRLEQTALSPQRVTITWPESQTLSSPAQTFNVLSDTLTARIETRAAQSLPLDRAALEAATLTVEDGAGGVTSLANLTASVLRAPDTTYEISVLAEGLVLSAPLLQDLGGELPQSLERVAVDGKVQFDAPWDLRAIDTARPQPRQIDLRLFEAAWGPMALKLSADLDVYAGGIPEGDVTIQAQNWREMLAVVDRADLVASHLVSALEDGLTFLSGLSGNSASLDVTLRLAGGRVFVGPIPIGPAPRLILR